MSWLLPLDASSRHGRRSGAGGGRSSDSRARRLPASCWPSLPSQSVHPQVGPFVPGTGRLAWLVTVGAAAGDGEAVPEQLPDRSQGSLSPRLATHGAGTAGKTRTPHLPETSPGNTSRTPDTRIAPPRRRRHPSCRHGNLASPHLGSVPGTRGRSRPQDSCLLAVDSRPSPGSRIPAKSHGGRGSQLGALPGGQLPDRRSDSGTANATVSSGTARSAQRQRIA